MNDAVDKVRRQENKALKQAGDDILVGTKQLWLFNPDNIHESHKEQFEILRQQELKTSRAWAIKEQFRWFWDYCYAGHAKNFFGKNLNENVPKLRHQVELPRHAEGNEGPIAHPPNPKSACRPSPLRLLSVSSE